MAANNPTGETCGWNVVTGVLNFFDDNSAAFKAHANAVLALHDPTKPMPKVLVGNDVVDAMTEDEVGKARRKDMLRLSCDDPANCLKSKVKRIAEAIGTTPDALLARATPTG